MPEFVGKSERRKSLAPRQSATVIRMTLRAHSMIRSGSRGRAHCQGGEQRELGRGSMREKKIATGTTVVRPPAPCLGPSAFAQPAHKSVQGFSLATNPMA